MLEALAKDGIKTLEDFATCADWELAGGWTTENGQRKKDEGVLEKFDMSLEEAQHLVMTARVMLGWVDPTELRAADAEDERTKTRRPRPDRRPRRHAHDARRPGQGPGRPGAQVHRHGRKPAKGGADPLCAWGPRRRWCRMCWAACRGGASMWRPTGRRSTRRRRRACSPAPRGSRSRCPTAWPIDGRGAAGAAGDRPDLAGPQGGRGGDGVSRR